MSLSQEWKQKLASPDAMTMALGMLAGCGADTPTSTAPEETSMQTQKPAPEAAPAEPGSDDTASVLDVPGMDGFDNTQDNANLDFTAHREMLKTLHTELPLVDEPVTLSYFLGFESSALNYVEGGDLHNQQVWKWLVENTGVNLELTVVERSALTDKLNLMIASGTYTDLMNLHDYSAGIETAYEEEIITDLIENGYVTGKPYMGVQVTSVPDYAQHYGVSAGAYVESVADGSCAQKAGLQADDIIIAIDDTAIDSSTALTAALSSGYKAGDTAKLTVLRGEDKMELTITFDEKNEQTEAANQPQQESNQQVQQQPSTGWPFGGFPW